MENTQDKNPSLLERFSQMANHLREEWKNNVEKEKRVDALINPNRLLNPLVKQLKQKTSSNSIEAYSAKLVIKACDRIREKEESSLTIVAQKDVKNAFTFLSLSPEPEIQKLAESMLTAVLDIQHNADQHANLSKAVQVEGEASRFSLNHNHKLYTEQVNINERNSAELSKGSLALHEGSGVSKVGLETLVRMEQMAAKVVQEVLKDQNASRKTVLEAGQRNKMAGLEDMHAFVVKASSEQNKSNSR